MKKYFTKFLFWFYIGGCANCVWLFFRGPEHKFWNAFEYGTMFFACALMVFLVKQAEKRNETLVRTKEQPTED